MKRLSHLVLNTLVVPAGADWSPRLPGWHVLRVVEGVGYWLGHGEPRELAGGGVMVLPPRCAGELRASCMGDLRLECVLWRPELLEGLLTLAERQYFAGAAAGAPRWFAADTDLSQRFSELAEEELRRTDFGHRSRWIEWMADVFAADMRQQAAAGTPGLQSTADRFQTVMGALTESELLQLDTAELARRCGCSLRHFNRLFRDRYQRSVRTHKTMLRMEKAGRLLTDSPAKVIDVAMETGYQSLGLFNALFKRYHGMTPSTWRTRSGGRVGRMVLWLAGLLWAAPFVPAAETNAPSAAARPFEVLRYQIEGNTVLPEEVITKTLADHTGTNATFETIRGALRALQLAYRGRGFVTVQVGLPQQQITNGVVRVQVTEGRLSDVVVTGNRHYSSNAILSLLPGLHTNMILNSRWFQPLIDRANASRDRQIYPELAPGPDPGTTLLHLKVKDRLPLHGRVEFNNASPPKMPDYRLNASLSYNNLWQKDHQAGVQYAMTPGFFKEAHPMTDPWFPDTPQIASYSAFYRAPVRRSAAPSPGGAVGTDAFGYDEATKRFQPPPPLPGEAEWMLFASRSVSDTLETLQSSTLTPPVVPPSGTLVIVDNLHSRILTHSENIGARWNQPVPDWGPLKSSVSLGLDYKHTRTIVRQRRMFQGILYVPEIGAAGPPFVEFPSPPVESVREQVTTVHSLPVTLGWAGSWSDKLGRTVLSLNNSFHVSGLLSDEAAFINASGNPEAAGTYDLVQGGVVREQKLGREWTASLRASGQWATGPLISGEQWGLGGQGGPRGYREREEAGDAGWRVGVEPASPVVDIGLVDGKHPMRVRAVAFYDYGRRYTFEPQGSQGRSLSGVGCGVVGSIGAVMDFRFLIAWPLTSIPTAPAGEMTFHFGASAQF